MAGIVDGWNFSLGQVTCSPSGGAIHVACDRDSSSISVSFLLLKDDGTGNMVTAGYHNFTGPVYPDPSYDNQYDFYALPDGYYEVHILSTTSGLEPVQSRIVACSVKANTGMKGFEQLEEYFLDNGNPTGNYKPNANTDPDYIPPVSDPITCPI